MDQDNSLLELAEAPGALLDLDESTPALPAVPRFVSSVASEPTPITVVIPCFKEEAGLAHLAEHLHQFQAIVQDKYEVHLVFVDDGSQDDTWSGLQTQFSGWPRTKLVQHPHNRGVAAAIRTGIEHATTEIVCSMDSDCTYAPSQFQRMLPLLEPHVSLVTASPYHAQGRVNNVPGWRLLLSKGASFLYRRVLRHKFATYTSCFRVYRRSSILALAPTHGGFQGIPELLALLDLKGERIIECPATLDVRKFGQSKMKLARTIRAHLRLLARLSWLRLQGRVQ